MWRDRGEEESGELEMNWRRKEGEMERERKRWGDSAAGGRWGNRGEKRRDERWTNKKVRMGGGG